MPILEISAGRPYSEKCRNLHEALQRKYRLNPLKERSKDAEQMLSFCLFSYTYNGITKTREIFKLIFALKRHANNNEGKMTETEVCKFLEICF
jgi:hypothetical protein